LVYPGGTSSIRFEKLREGIADYEKIHLLRALAAHSSQARAKRLMKDLESHLATLIGDRDPAKREYDVTKMAGALETGRGMIDVLSSELAK
jgi:hypothetical protein